MSPCCLAQEREAAGIDLDSNQRSGARDPWMPHNELNANDLELQYPSLGPVEDLDMPDLSRRG